ncbi:metallophosphoesterase family protein [Algibacillus agarilyticus]|uniref:metallophosphoesterase family protein n=1 Tax=Algibacillus agarilyticus TaxID=2234133 RepID=UPI001300871C|nr:metallophosphoesterase [Algibacillus agarilyticus]
MTQYSIAQLSDLHLLSDPKACYEGANPFVNLTTALDYLFLRQHQYHAILITGDLVQEITPETYTLLNKVIADYDWQLPFICIAGNHDDKVLMQTYLTAPVFSWQWPFLLGDWALVHVDSTIPMQAKGLIDNQKIKQLPNLSSLFTLVVLHHHLQPCHSFMDKYIAEYDDEFMNWLSALPNKKSIVHGHIHSSRHYRFMDVDVYACPATSIEYLHDRPAFEIGRLTPGLNELVLQSNGDLLVNTVWL